MSHIKVGNEYSSDINLYYEDHGSGKPLVLIHGWPLSGRSWEKQLPVLLDAGYRVITYDRRGFGDSSKPTSGYDYDTFAKDLQQLLAKLNLRDAVLVGFSMGGGEVARYIGTYGSQQVRGAVFISAVTPFLLKTPDNPSGVEDSVFEGIKKAIAQDRLAFLSKFLSDFYNVNVLGGKRISDEVVRFSWNIAAGASPKGTLDCVSTWTTDFRTDLSRLNMPALVIHGDADRICPIEATGRWTHKAVNGSRLVEVKDGPHGLTWTHAEQVNRELLDFLRMLEAGRAQKLEQAPMARAA